MQEHNNSVNSSLFSKSNPVTVGREVPKRRGWSEMRFVRVIHIFN